MKTNPDFGQTPLSEEDSAGLIPKHITTRQELNEAEFANINRAYLKYFAGKLTSKKVPFTPDWLKKLHCEMFGDIWVWAGKIRVKDISPGIPVHQIATQLAQFYDDLKAWEEFKHEPVEISAKIHHRLVWIHPFRNGNGRWARFAANLYLKMENQPVVAWPENDLSKGSFRKNYVRALQDGDRGDFAQLIALHRKLSQQEPLK